MGVCPSGLSSQRCIPNQRQSQGGLLADSPNDEPNDGADRHHGVWVLGNPLDYFVLHDLPPMSYQRSQLRKPVLRFLPMTYPTPAAINTAM